jgi:hypothetical protein
MLSLVPDEGEETPPAAAAKAPQPAPDPTPPPPALALVPEKEEEASPVAEAKLPPPPPSVPPMPELSPPPVLALTPDKGEETSPAAAAKEPEPTPAVVEARQEVSAVQVSPPAPEPPPPAALAPVPEKAKDPPPAVTAKEPLPQPPAPQPRKEVPAPKSSPPAQVAVTQPKTSAPAEPQPVKSSPPTPKPQAVKRSKDEQKPQAPKVSRLPSKLPPARPAQAAASAPAAKAPPAEPARPAARKAPAPAAPRQGSANVIALSANRTLVDVVRDSLAGSHRVWRADDVAHAGELIVTAGNAVLLVDASLPGLDTREFVGRVHEQFPDLVIVAVVNRDNEAPLAPLVASGAILRCIDVAATADSIRALMDATKRGPRSAVNLPAAAPRRSLAAAVAGLKPSIKVPRLTLPKIRVSRASIRRWSGRCIKLVAAVLAAWALWQWKPWTYAVALLPEPEPSRAEAAAAAVDKRAARLQKLLADAEIALTRNRLVDPPGKNALELYRAALELDPANDMARWGINTIADRLLAEADVALQQRDLPGLASAIDAARSVRPDDPRLAEYSARLRREQERIFGPGAKSR